MTTIFPHPRRRENGAPSNWDRYTDLLTRKSVPEKARPWYVRHVEGFLKAIHPCALSELTGSRVTDYIQQEAIGSRLSDWQFRQFVDALHILLVDLARVPAGKAVDWDYWKAGARTLEPDHPTLAKAQAPGSVASPRFARSTEAFPVLKDLARTVRAMQYSIRTEQGYVDWCHRFLLYSGDRPIDSLGEEDVQRFLSHLAVERSVAAKTQSVAFNAVAFLFKHVLERPLGEVQFSRTKRSTRLPVVLTREEVRCLLDEMDGTLGFMALLMYGTGMRLMECVRLRVADVDFGQDLIVVRNGKGGKDRVVPLPARARPGLQAHLAQVEAKHKLDSENGAGEVFLPDALARKYPSAAREWIWQYVFPSGRLSQDPKSGRLRRHHLHETSLQRQIKAAGQRAGIPKRVNSHSLRKALT